MYRYGEESLELTLWGPDHRSAIRMVLLHWAGQAVPDPEVAHSGKVFSHWLSDDLLWIRESRCFNHVCLALSSTGWPLPGGVPCE